MIDFIGLEAVHLDEQLVERLLALVIAAAETGAAMTADRIDFVDEDDARRILLGLFEHVAHTARANADEHLDEVRTGNGEERHIGFARNRARQKGLTRSGRSDQQHAARNLAAQTLELLRIAQKLDDLFQILLGLVDAGDVGECYTAMRFGQKLRLRFAEAHRAGTATLHLTHEEDPHAEDDDHRQPGEDIGQERIRAVILRPGTDFDALILKPADQIGIARRIGLEGRSGIAVGAADLFAGNRHPTSHGRSRHPAGTASRTPRGWPMTSADCRTC
jgi:hypothetical protein